MLESNANNTSKKGETGNRSKFTVNVQLENFLKHLFIDKKIKQSQIADALNVKRASIGDKISRNGKMSVDSLATIADVIGCDLVLTFIDRETGQQWTCKDVIKNNSDTL